MYRKISRVINSTGVVNLFVLKGKNTLYVGFKFRDDPEIKFLWKEYSVKNSTEIYRLMGIWASEEIVSLLLEE